MSDHAHIELEAVVDEPERGYGVDEALVRACDAAIADDRMEEVDELIAGLHASDLADLLEELAGENRRKLLDNVRDQLDPEVLTHMDYVVREDVLEILEPEEVAAVLSGLNTDDALDVFEISPPPIRLVSCVSFLLPTARSSNRR